MFSDWSIWGSVIAFGVIGMFIRVSHKKQLTFNKKIKYIHVRSMKKF